MLINMETVYGDNDNTYTEIGIIVNKYNTTENDCSKKAMIIRTYTQILLKLIY